VIRNAIRQGAIAFSASVSTGAVAYAVRSDADVNGCNVTLLIALLASIFGLLAAHAEDA
jgi:hypothetical protein